MPNLVDHTIIPLDPRERNLWVIYQLKLRGKTLKAVAAEIGITEQSLHHALYKPSLRAEEKLAKTLGLTPEELFPERYGDAGNRLVEVRPRRGRPPKVKEKAA